MRIFILISLLASLVSIPAQGQEKAGGQNVEVRAGIRHDALDHLLKKYVNNRGLVNYSGWKANRTDMTALNDYLKQFAAKAEPAAKGNERSASLANAYNGFVLQWILQNYPTDSIWELNDSFKGKRHEVNGRKVSLDDIENGALRPAIGWRAHSVLVCAARSCPPLQREAYGENRFAQQDAHAYEVWLARSDLNKFLPKANKVEISSIFKWFKSDFAKAGGVPKVLAMYAPSDVRQFAASGSYQISYVSYNWGLNDQGSHGRHYSKLHLLFDNLF